MAKGKKTGGRDWKKGEGSPNPNGRPAEPFAPYVRAFLEEADPKRKRERREVLLEVLYRCALDGSAPAAKELFDRAHGKPPQEMTHKGDAERPIHVRLPDRPSA